MHIFWPETDNCLFWLSGRSPWKLCGWAGVQTRNPRLKSDYKFDVQRYWARLSFCRFCSNELKYWPVSNSRCTGVPVGSKILWRVTSLKVGSAIHSVVAVRNAFSTGTAGKETWIWFQKVAINWAASWQNQQNDLCTQQRLSLISLRCPHEGSLGP